MECIVITLPHFFKEEAGICNRLFAAGLHILHLRKPGTSAEETEQFIRNIDEEYHNRIVIHEHYELAGKFNLKGIHLKSGTSFNPAYKTYQHVSISCHSVEEIEKLEFTPSYCFLSPLFDSISKQGYHSRFTKIPNIKEYSFSFPVIALGGITVSKIPLIFRNGFGGMAAIGYFWENPEEAVNRYIRLNAVMNMNIHALKIQYITDHKENFSIEEQVEAVCKGGIRWVQLRMKETRPEVVEEKGRSIKEICRKYNTLFIINDNPQIAKSIEADGVHLGKEDMSPSEARKLLGEGKIIGATCNTFEDIREAVRQGADYVGVGPFTFTTTKKKLSPVLGLEGYRYILQQMEENGISIPVYAIGGIKEEDISPLMSTGINGIALSGLIKNSSDMEAKTKEILKELEMRNEEL